MSTFRRAPLHFISTEPENRLRCQAEVPHDRNSRFDNMNDDFFIAGDPLEFDGARTGANQRLDSFHRSLKTSPVRAEWKVGDEKGFRTDTTGSGNMRSHHINGGKNGAFVSIQNHGNAVTHEQAIDTGLERDPGEDRIIDAKHRNLSPIL